MKKTLFILLLLTTQVGYSCINGKGINIFGQESRYDMPLFRVRKLEPIDYLKIIKEKERELLTYTAKEKNTWDYCNEMAILKIYKGEYKEAKKLLFQASKLDKFNYSVCSNLGVVYELMGNPDSAYYYTKKAVKMNPDSHRNSEWIHLKILEAGKKMESSPEWIYDYSVLGFKFAKSELPLTKYDIGKDSLKGRHYVEEMILQIEYQLKERMVFVKPENKIVANLLFSLGELYITEIDYKKAALVYELAKEYDPKLTEVCNKRLKHIDYHYPFAEQLKNALENKYKAEDLLRMANNKVAMLKIKKTYTALGVELSNHFIEKRKREKYIYAGGGILILFLIFVFIRRRKKSLHP